MRLRLVARALTQIIAVLQMLVEAIMRKRKKAAKSARPNAVEDVGERMRAAGIHDALVSRTEVYDAASGHTFEVWELGQWGQDSARMDVLGRGADLPTAVAEWERGRTAGSRRRFSSGR